MPQPPKQKCTNRLLQQKASSHPLEPHFFYKNQCTASTFSHKSTATVLSSLVHTHTHIHNLLCSFNVLRRKKKKNTFMFKFGSLQNRKTTHSIWLLRIPPVFVTQTQSATILAANAILMCTWKKSIPRCGYGSLDGRNTARCSIRK